MTLLGQHILQVNQFNAGDLQTLGIYTDRMERFAPTKVLAGKTLACVFYEPSTRTSSSFIAAMTKLGGDVIPITQGVQFSSVAKGESLEDTIRTLGQYADAIVLRHPEVGAVARAAKASPVPVINAGDGIGEHPTQGLLDFFTIKKELGRTDRLKVAFVGDLRHSRTVHSLLQLLARQEGNQFHLISPWDLRLEPQGSELYDNIRSKIIGTHHVRSSLDEAAVALAEADVVYMTRVQKERFTNLEEYELVKDSCLLTPEMVHMMKEKSAILHPLPRINEIPTSIDSDPRAAYFRQVKMGLHVRMALLALVLGA